MLAVTQSKKPDRHVAAAASLCAVAVDGLARLVDAVVGARVLVAASVVIDVAVYTAVSPVAFLQECGSEDAAPPMKFISAHCDIKSHQCPMVRTLSPPRR